MIWNFFQIDLCKLIFKTADKNKEVTELEPSSRAYKRFRPNWTYLYLKKNFFGSSSKLEKNTILELEDYKISTCKNYIQ